MSMFMNYEYYNETKNNFINITLKKSLLPIFYT